MTMALILRRGWRAGMISSRSTQLNSDPVTLSDPRSASSVSSVAIVIQVPRGVFRQEFFYGLPKGAADEAAAHGVGLTHVDIAFE